MRIMAQRDLRVFCACTKTVRNARIHISLGNGSHCSETLASTVQSKNGSGGNGRIHTAPGNGSRTVRTVLGLYCDGFFSLTDAQKITALTYTSWRCNVVNATLTTCHHSLRQCFLEHSLHQSYIHVCHTCDCY